jgi:Xaa-Pro aminopeptidase
MHEFSLRRSRLQAALVENGLDGFLLTQNVDLYYFTGSMQNGYAFVPAIGEAIFYVRRSVSRACEEATCVVKALGSFRDFEQTLLQDFPYLVGIPFAKIATEFDVLPVQIYHRLQSVLPNLEIVDGSLWLRELRMIKSDYEVACIQKAAEMVDAAFEASLASLTAGVSEVAFMAIIERELRARGHIGVMRMRGYNQEIITGMVASGAAAAVPTYFDGPAGGLGLHPAAPQGSSSHVIEANQPILVDIGCCVEGYVIDQTRTVVIGELSDSLKQAYKLTVQILKETEKQLKPGVICEDIYSHSIAMVAGTGLAQSFMGFGDDRVSFLGHGIGLEIDEFPVLAKGFKYALQPGMVIAIEPKFSFPGIGVVGIEDTYLITESGFRRLTVTAQKLFQV